VESCVVVDYLLYHASNFYHSPQNDGFEYMDDCFPDCVVGDDRCVLINLYNSTNGGQWIRKNNWLTNEPLSAWQGVALDTDNRVAILNLGTNNLTGSITSKIGYLTHLTLLNLGTNNLSGEVPSEIGDLTNLEQLYLDHNHLTIIPPEIDNLNNLGWLYLNNNDFGVGSCTVMESLINNLSTSTDFIYNPQQNNSFIYLNDCP